MDIKKNARIECTDGNEEVLMTVMDNTSLLRITYSEKGSGTVMKRKEILTTVIESSMKGEKRRDMKRLKMLDNLGEKNKRI